MKDNALFKRALCSLAHPISLGAVVVLLLNALVWQPAAPSWLTGKIGDCAWMVFAPFLALLPLALLLPSRWAVDERKIGLAAFALVGMTFSLLKTVPALNAAVNRGMAGIGCPLKLSLDPTDLLALPGLLLAWLVWQHPLRRASAGLRWMAAGVATVAVLADMPAPQDLGFTCLAVDGGNIVVVNEAEVNYRGRSSYRLVYESGDGGLTWTEIDRAPSAIVCSVPAWPIVDPRDSRQQFFGVEGAIYRSEDGGQTLVLEQRVGNIRGAVAHEASGNIVVAADSVWVRTPDGTWQEALQSEW